MAVVARAVLLGLLLAGPVAAFAAADEGPYAGNPQGASKFWAFRPIVEPDPPQVTQSDWPLSPIDSFVLAKLEEHGLAPAPAANRRTLIRRVYFDLIGLPPAPEEIEQFVNDESPDAFARVVDRLLDSPHFGERWGRHWLDVARYAESSGGGRAILYDNAWRYRDYVIESFNADKPFDRFVTEQIAGDLLPYESAAERHDGLVGTGFLMLGPTNYENQDKELLRMDVVDEQIDTLGRVFLGMTIGCARCHDHKFDPIPTRDYYALVGILRSTKVLTPGNVSGYVQRELPVSDSHRAALERHEQAVKPVQTEIDETKSTLKGLRAQLGEGKGTGIAASSLPGIVVDDDEAELSGAWKASSSIRQFVGSGYRHAGRGTAEARYAPSVSKPGRFAVRIAYAPHQNRATNVPVTIRHAAGSTTRRINQRQTPPIDGLFVPLGTYRFEPGEPATVVISCADADGAVIADAVQLLPADRPAVAASGAKGDRAGDREQDDRTAELRARVAATEKQLKSLEAKLKELNTQAPPPPPVAMAVRDEKETGDYRVCIRGNVHQFGEPVPRGFLSATGPGEPPQIPTGESGRRELAEWLVSRENPLTPRVMVNRIWRHLFGAGLVRTVDNFGKMGEQPSHPELLDWLASRFRDPPENSVGQASSLAPISACLTKGGWSVKRMIRLIVLSRAYQQSSRFNSRGDAVDPDNRLLWRMNRRRLDAEAIRDSVLAAAGRLDLTIGGRTLRPGTKSEYGYRFRTLRRSVYIPVLRNELHEIFAVFDFADPNLVVGDRATSTLPTQALYLMNSPFVIEQSRHAAERLLARSDLDDAARLDVASRRILGRPPTRAERELAVRYLARFASESAIGEGEGEQPRFNRLDAWATVVQSLFGCVDFRYVD